MRLSHIIFDTQNTGRDTGIFFGVLFTNKITK